MSASDLAVLNNGLELTWLGHSTWLMKTPGGKRFLFDPWLGNPSCPEGARDSLGHLDGILVTHGHFDHVADLEVIAKESGATVVAIFDLTSWLESKGIENTLGMNKGGTVELAGVKITLTHAVHSSSFMEGGLSLDLGDPCGFVLELENGFKVYNAGDTDVFGDMALIRELDAPDLAMLPIGDHFTMGPRRAAKAASLLGVRYIVPQHYGTFPLLTGTPEALREHLHEGCQVLAVEPGGVIR
jgi:L-ascorbate metabolism protein UlaG (beta-lactamase superfamily)